MPSKAATMSAPPKRSLVELRSLSAPPILSLLVTASLSVGCRNLNPCCPMTTPSLVGSDFALAESALCVACVIGLLTATTPAEAAAEDDEEDNDQDDPSGCRHTLCSFLVEVWCDRKSMYYVALSAFGGLAGVDT